MNGGREDYEQGCDSILDVSTECAEYVIHPGAHHEPARIDKETLRDMDGFAVESGMTQYDDLYLDDLRKNRQFRGILSSARAAEKNIFVVDVPYRQSDARVFLGAAGGMGVPFLAGLAGGIHTHAGLGLLTLPALAFCAGGTRRSSFVNTVAGYAQLSNAYNAFGFRSAVAAEKLEQFVAPRLREEIGKTPRILVAYGAGHLDVAAYLRHPALRRNVIRVGKRTLRTTLDMTHLSKVCEFRCDTGAYEKAVHEASF